MPLAFCVIDDKHVPLYRILWIAATPHYCGSEECEVEGCYEVRLEQDESLWANRPDRDKALKALEDWCSGRDLDRPEGEWN